ncbi:MAG: DUF2142 domain-containing protein [Lysobacteraceae bacterium]|nr:MAG: DUF2142 domain-containing protein [Xanthomonadaceae bacterium]
MHSTSGWRHFDSVYLLLCAPLILALIYLLPPFQAPDEAAHFYRAVQISHGQVAPALAPRTYRAGAGGMVDQSAYALVDAYCGIPNWSCARQDRPALSDLVSSASGQGDRRIVPFSNTVVYLPVAHAVPALAIALARAVGLPPLGWLYAGRLANGLFTLTISWLALYLLRTKNAAILVFAVATLPMVSSIVPTLCADSPVIGCSLLLLALCVRLVEGAPVTRWFGALLLVTVVYASAAKLAYLPLAVMPLASALAGKRSPTVVIGTGLVALAAIAVTLLWSSSIRGYVFPISPDLRVDPKGQIAFVLGHPIRFIVAIVNSIVLETPNNLKTIIGRKLSDQKVLLPWIIVLVSAATLALAAATAGTRMTKIPIRIATFLLVAACAGATFAFLYIQNSPVGGLRVDGYQGRYLIPLIPFVALLLPPPASWLPVNRATSRRAVALGGSAVTISLAIFLAARTWGVATV